MKSFMHFKILNVNDRTDLSRFHLKLSLFSLRSIVELWPFDARCRMGVDRPWAAVGTLAQFSLRGVQILESLHILSM